jgi:hypothetical protein
MPRTRTFHGPEAITKHLPPSHLFTTIHTALPIPHTPALGGKSGMADGSVIGATAPHAVTQAEFPAHIGNLAGKGLHVGMPSHVTGHRGEPRLRNMQPPASA